MHGSTVSEFSSASYAKDIIAWLTISTSSFAYLELYISISQVIRSFHLRLHDLRELAYSYADLSTGKQDAKSWTPVPLPRRREWVAAVPTEQLKIKMTSRS
jgi:hypothetical protein